MSSKGPATKHVFLPRAEFQTELAELKFPFEPGVKWSRFLGNQVPLPNEDASPQKELQGSLDKDLRTSPPSWSNSLSNPLAAPKLSPAAN